jgi:hypothetical protein
LGFVVASAAAVVVVKQKWVSLVVCYRGLMREKKEEEGERKKEQ